MSNEATERLSHGRDERGRLTQFKLMELAALAKKTMDAMATKGRAATDNYFFMNDVHSACWQAVEQEGEIDSYRQLYIRERELVKLLVEKADHLERELSGYRTVEHLVRAGTLQQTEERVKLRMKRAEQKAELKSE